jgi:PAS domain S-box-containing protein
MEKILLISKIFIIVMILFRATAVAIKEKGLKNKFIFMALFALLLVDLRRFIFQLPIDLMTEVILVVLIIYFSQTIFNSMSKNKLLFNNVLEYQAQLVSEIIENVKEGIAIVSTNNLDIIASNHVFNQFLIDCGDTISIPELISHYNRGEKLLKIRTFDNEEKIFLLNLTELNAKRFRIHIDDVTDDKRNEEHLIQTLNGYNFTLEHVSIPFFMMTESHLIQRINLSAKQLFQTIDGEGEQLETLLHSHSELLLQVLELKRQSLKSNESVQGVYRVLDFFGRTKYFEIIIVPIEFSNRTDFAVQLIDRTDVIDIQTQARVFAELHYELFEDTYVFYDLIMDRAYSTFDYTATASSKLNKTYVFKRQLSEDDIQLFDRIKHSSTDSEFLLQRVGKETLYHIAKIFRDDKKNATAIILKRQRSETDTTFNIDDIGKQILPHLSDGIIVVDLAHQIVHVNEVLLRLLGYSKETLLSKHFEDITFESNTENFSEKLNLIRKNQSLHYERQLISAEGQCVPVDIIALPVLFSEEEYVLFLVRDRREHNKYKERFMASQNKYEQIINTLQDGIIEISIPERHVSIIQAIAIDKQFIGMELTFYEWLDNIHEDDRGIVNESIDIITSEKKEKFIVDYRFLLKGKWVWTRSTGNYIRDDRGEFILLVNQNIDEIMKMTEALDENKFILNESEKISSMAHWKFDMSDNQFLTSENFSNVLKSNRSSREVTMEGFLEHIHPADRQFFQDKFYEMVWDKAHLNLIYRYIRFGEVRYIQIMGECYYTKQGEPQYAIGNIMDITEKMTIETRLENSRKLLDAIIDQSPTGIIVIKRFGNVEMINNTAKALLEVTADEKVSASYLKAYIEEHFKHVDGQNMRLIVANLLSSESFSTRLIKEDSAYIDLISSPLLDEEGRYTGNIIILIDMSEREHLNRQLKIETSKLIRAENMASLAHFEFYNNFKKLHFSDAILNILEVDEKPELTLEQLYLLISEGDVEHVKQQIEKLRHYDGKMTLEFDIKISPDRTKHVLVNVERNLIDGKKFFDGTVQDVTVLHQAIEKAKRSENEKTSILNSVTDQITFYDNDHRIIDYNHMSWRKNFSHVKQIKGEKCKDVFITKEHICEACLVAKTISTGKPMQREFEHDNKWYLHNTYPVFDDKSNQIGVVEVVRNITNEHLVKNRYFEVEKFKLMNKVSHDMTNLVKKSDIYFEKVKNLVEKPEMGEIDPSFVMYMEKKWLEIRQMTFEMSLLTQYENEEKQMVPIRFFIQRLKQMTKYLYEEDLSVDSDVENDHLVISTCKERLCSCFMSVIINAYEANKRGETPNVTLKVRASQLESDLYQVTFKIIDKGIGISEGDMDKLLVPFYTTKNDGNHAGLGLTLAKRYLEEIGAGISYSNEPEGTTFTIVMNDAHIAKYSL